MTLLPPLRLTGATILRDGEMQRRSVALAEGRLTTGPLPEVDLSGYYILPGIVDLHAGGLERLIAPQGQTGPLTPGLISASREAATHGITTALFAQDWSWEGGSAAPARAFALAEALTAARSRLPIDMRLRLTCETHLVEAAEDLLALVERHRIPLVVFRDRVERVLEQRREDPERFALNAARAGLAPETLLRAAEQAMARAREVPRHLCRLAEAFDRFGTIYGSQGDADGETRERFAMIGARVAEFPAGRRAAVAAHAMMNPVVLSATGLAAGGPDGTATVDLIRQGHCDALASGSHLPALAEAAWALVDLGLLTLPRAWALISSGPAAILRLPDRGTLTPGQRADLVVVHAETRTIEAVVSGGCLSHLSGEAGSRFLGRATALGLAAE